MEKRVNTELYTLPDLFECCKEKRVNAEVHTLLVLFKYCRERCLCRRAYFGSSFCMFIVVGKSVNAELYTLLVILLYVVGKCESCTWWHGMAGR